MTTTPATGSQQTDIPALHATIAPSSVLHGERRTLYQLAADLLEGACSRVLDPDVIDSPLTRKQIGDALAGRSRLACSQLVGISTLAAADSAVHNLRVASRPEANTLLAEALDHIGAELWRQQETSGPPRLLTETDGERFTSALAVVRDGVALAQSFSPELSEDLLTHVALVAILNPQRAGGLASGSSRAVPGLVVLKASSSVDVAEALVHEGAHQKLFDLAITHDLLSADSDRCPPFHPPWAPKDRRWPIEQTLAACHAYACLARFWQDIDPPTGAVMVGADSLLPVASERSEIIGQWLLDKGDHLGPDAHTLLKGMLGQRPRTASTAERCSDASAANYVIDTALELRRCGSDRVLVGRPSRPPQLYWVSEDAAGLLELLKYKPLDELIDTFAQRWCVPKSDARNRVTALLSDLSASGLVTAKAR
ncbi:MAG: PqqD family peptide modification chaperone [Pseudonocardiaceae bacterium]